MFGYDLPRTGYNPNEQGISTANVGTLHLKWSANLGGNIDGSPIVIPNVQSGNGVRNMLFIGSESGTFTAFDADSGAVIWSKQLGSFNPTPACSDLGGGPFGISGSAAADVSGGRIYVADGQNNVHSLSMASGAETSGWPIMVESVAQNHIYSAPAFNSNDGMLYVSTAGYCDDSPWQGALIAINTASASVTSTFFPEATQFGGSGSGGGIWGPISVAIDPASNDVFIATGNADGGSSEHAGYGEQVLRLPASLSTNPLPVSNYPGLSGVDSDFGATPIIFQPPGCNPLVVAKNKDGVMMEYQRDSIASGPVEQLTMAFPNPTGGNFIGIAAYSPVTHFLYVSDYENSPDGKYAGGMNALSLNGSCQLQAKWKSAVPIGSGGADVPVSPPVVANGVVYFGSGISNTLYAFNASTGAQLWSSGSTIKGPIFAAPVVDGNLYVGSWDHNFYAFGL